MKAINLRTEHLINPLGIDIGKPYLSWNCMGGKRQSAYEIEAVSDGRVIWNSGKVISGRMNGYLGVAAGSKQRIDWKVRLWDENDSVGEWSEAAWFEMGILDKSQFVAKWINPELTCDPAVHKPASYLKTTFNVEKAGRARLYITCHGLYEAYINGHRVGDFVLAPGAYTYDKKLAYQTYDVTELIAEGGNEAQVILGDGWYRSCSGVDGDRNLYGEDVALYFQLEVDGKAVCVSDESWVASQSGAIRENDMQQGEVVDARLEEIKDYHEVKVEAFETEKLTCPDCVPIAEMERFEGKVIRTPNGETVIDYGQNLAGYVEFTLNAHAGDKIILTHGEALDENGNFTAENFQDRKRHKEGGTKQMVVYTCKEGENHYKSKFTIWGFRYAKVETDADISSAVFTSIAVYSRMEQLGRFECSDEAVNRLVENSIWSQKSNFCDVPTDCPTRERAAWTGDMGVFVETGLSLMDCYPVIRKWLGECRLNQHEDGKVANIAPKNNVPSFFSGLLAGSVGWGDACIIVPYALYQRYGDRRILEENYEMMQKWYAYLESRAGQKQNIQPQGMQMQLAQKYAQNIQNMQSAQKQDEQKQDVQSQIAQKQDEQKQDVQSQIAQKQDEQKQDVQSQIAQKQDEQKQDAQDGAAAGEPYMDYAIETGVDYGEWCEPNVESTSAMQTPQGKVATAYFAWSGELLSEIAEILGKEEDAARYSRIAGLAKEAFRHIATENGRIHSDRQAEYVRAVAFELLPEQEKRQAADDLNQLVVGNDYHLNTGFLSTPFICQVLSQYGHVDTAYKLLLQDSAPSWLYAVKKGATTIWETWDGINEKGEVKASLNHYSYGAISGWLFSGVCGIRVERDKISISPQPCEALKYAKAQYQSPLGEIVSAWEYKDGQVIYEVQIPPNTEAELILPDGRREELEAGRHCIVG